MHGFVSKLHLYLGWGGAQGSLSGVGQELIEETIKTGEVKLPYNDTDTILRNVSNALLSKYKVASEITFEVAKLYQRLANNEKVNYVAILSDSKMLQAAAKFIIKEINKQEKIRWFNEKEKAIAWLEKL